MGIFSEKMSKTKNNWVVIPLGAWIHEVSEQAKTGLEEHILSDGKGCFP